MNKPWFYEPGILGKRWHHEYWYVDLFITGEGRIHRLSYTALHPEETWLDNIKENQ